MSDPRISAIVPNFNHAKLLPRSIGALANQSVPPHEIVVVDDASTDDSVEVLASLARRYPLVRVIRNERNLGVNESMNRGITLATGDYVLFPAADDEVRPGLFENAVRMFRQFPQAGICSGMTECHDTVTGRTWLNGGGMPRQHCFLSPAEMVTLARQGRLMINNQNAVFRKTVLQEAGGWIPELKWFSDWFGDYVIGFRHGMCSVPEVLSVFYWYPQSYGNAKPQGHPERVEVMRRAVELLEAAPCADVLPLIRDSGMLGQFGWPMVKIVAGERKHRHFLTVRFLRNAARRTAEITGKRFFPDWLARWCLKVFYGRK